MVDDVEVQAIELIVIVPHGFNEKGNPTSLTFAGNVFGETAMLTLAKAYQDATDWHRRHPKLFP